MRGFVRFIVYDLVLGVPHVLFVRFFVQVNDLWEAPSDSLTIVGILIVCTYRNHSYYLFFLLSGMYYN